jgi:uncharacterized protein (UPF0332 family)
LALFLKTGINIKTSKHIGIISLFDKEFIQVKKIDKRYSKILHRIFNIRQEGDYKEFVEISVEDAREYVGLAKEFLDCIKDYAGKVSA